MMRIGSGFDVHAFASDAPGADPAAADSSQCHIMLGGVAIPHSLPLLAHSDGDVLIHALCDALLGALGHGDIGQHFPPNDERWRGVSGAELLQRVMDQVSADGYQVVNADLTVIAERPKVGPHREAMQRAIANGLKTEPNQVNVKATTTEGLGFCGRGEGIAAMATVLLTR